MANHNLCDLDLNKNALLNAVIHPLGTAPSNPVEGQIYYDNTGGDKQIYVWNDSAWVSMGGDIIGVTAGTGLTGGGTGGTVTLNVIGGTGITANSDDIALTNGLIADGSNITSVGTLTALQVDNININGSAITGSTSADLVINVTDGQSVVVEGLDIDDGVVTGASSITSTSFVGALTGDASGSAGTVTNIGSLTGEVTSNNRATVIAGNVVDEANLKVSNDPTNGYFLSAQSGATGGMTWAAISSSISGNAATATALETGRTIAMTGDVAWTSGSFDGTANVTGTSTIGGAAVHHAMLNNDIISGQGAMTAVDQVDLLMVDDGPGTVKKITFSNFEDEIFGNVSGDGTIAAGGALTVTGSDGHFTVGGNLTVSGTTTTIDSTTVAIADSMLKLAKDQGTSTDAVDFGFYGQYGVSGTAKYAGIFRDLSATGDPFTFFDSLQAEPGATVNTVGTGYDLADISAGGITAADGFTGDITGDLTGNADTVTTNANLTGHITSSGNAAILGSFTSAQLNTAISNATLSGNNTGDQTNISGNAATVTTNANLTGHITSSGNAAALGSFTVAQLSTALSNASISGNNTGDETQSSINDLAITTVGTLDTGNATAIVSAASAIAAGKVELANTAEVLAGIDTSRAVTPAGLAARTGSWNLIVAAGTAVDGSVATNSDKTWTITHGMGSSLLYMVQVIRTANGSGETVFPCITRTTATTIINFNVSPTSGDYTVVVVKI